ncbi:nucleoporin NUP221, putative [Plasmodium yoelii]|uniref:Nucleoporin NUP221, putative n=1 Tax=Plasmodium yoelii TaxID=5861 RepID=A0A4V0KGU4_PLAYE|nr:nucleoporin NUP221, putative [Plasmodium yoelii]VTZ73474.1 nucleoporin NUP221, putative [Plasmodium yoelii]|eukprot:XP_022811592.1 nucleoporin NUP221, putative [Plasmodium yoelii]
MYMQNSSSNNVFGSYNNQGNNLNKGLFGNAGNPSSLTNTNTSNLFGGSKPQQTNNMMVNKNLFSMGTTTSGLDGNKSIYDSMNNQSNLGNKNLFGTSTVNNNSMQSGGGMVRNNLFMNTNNQNNLNMKNIFDSGSNLNNAQGTNLSNKGLFGGLQQNNQSSSGGNLFGNLSSQTNSGSIYSGLSSGANQNKGTGLFGTSGNTNQVSSTSSLFGGTSTMGQNKLGGVFGNLQSTDQNAQNSGNTTNSLFGGMSGNQLKPMSTGSNLFGGMSTNTTTNTGTSNLFGNNNAASGMNQNKPGGFFGNLQGSNQGTTGSSMFGNSSNAASGMSQNKPGGFFGNLQGSNQGTTGSSMFGGMSSGMNQNKPGGLLGNLQSPNQGTTGTTTSSSIFGNSASGMNQNRGTTLFSGMSNTGTSTTNTTNNLFGGTSTMGQNKLGGVFGNLQSTDQNAQNSGNTTNSLFGGMSGNQLKPMSTGSNLFGGMSTNTTTNTGTSNLFGNNNAASGMNQNKPSSNIFGSLSSTTQPTGTTTSGSSTTGNIFGSTQTANQGMGSNVFGSSMGMNQNKFGNIFGGTNTNQSSTMSSTFGNTGLGTSGISSTSALGSGTNTSTGLGGGLGISSSGIGGTGTNTGMNISNLTNTTGGTTTGISTSSGSSNLFGGLSSTSNTNTMSLGDNKNLFGSKPGFSLGTGTNISGQSSTNLGLGTNLGSGLLSPSMNTTTSSVLGTNLGSSSTGSTNLLTGLTGGIGSSSTLGLGTTTSPTIGLSSSSSNILGSTNNVLNNTSLSSNLLSSGSGMNQTGISFLGDKNLIGGNQGNMQNNLLTVDGKDKGNDLLTNKLNINKESSENLIKTTKFDDDLIISKKKEDIFNKAYDDENDISNDEMNLIKNQDGTFYNYINLIINDNINDIQKTTFSLLNDHDSLMWDNFKSSIFKNFVDYLVNFKQKKNQKIIKSNVLDLDQHEFQILIWLYNINSYKIDFIPFKSFYYLLLSDTNLNYSKMFISNSDKSILPRNFVEINDHYYMNYKSYFLKSQINKHHDNYSTLNRDGIGNSSNGGVSGNSISIGMNNSVLDIDSIYKQILKDILNSLLNMNLSITKENIKKKEKEEYYENGDINNKNNGNCGSSYIYENLLLNYLFGTLQHLHDKFYKLEISNYLSKDLNQIDEYFVDTKSNEIFSYCYDNFYKNEMDKENCTIHFFFYLVNIMFRCGNYIGLIQIIKNDEFIKNLNIDSYLNDFIILLIRILLLIYNQSNEISIFENMKIDIDCSDIFKKKIHMSNLINFFHSILYLCSNNIYAYDLLCILFSDIFYKKGNMYTNREKKIEMKNIFYYVQKKKRNSNYVDNNSDRNSSNEDNYDSGGDNNNIGRGSNSTNINKGGKGKGNERKGFFLDVFTNMLHKSKKSKDDEDEPFGTMEINEEIEKLNRESMNTSNTEMLGITNKYSYNFEYCNIETSIWIELSLFLSKNFDLYGSKFQENFDILDTNLSYYNYDDDNNAFLNDTKHRRDMINSKIEELFISISNCIINENREYFSVCSKLRVDDVINNFIIVDGKISEKVKSNVFKVLRTNFLLYIKLFYYLLLVGNIYVTVGFLSCISNNIQRILLVLTIFLHKNNVFENSKLNNIKIKTLGFLKLKTDNSTILYNSKDINDNVSTGSDNMNLILLSMNNIDIPFDYFLLRNNNINILLKASYLLNLKTNISIKLLKSIVQENQGILLNESIIGHINNDGNIFYGKLHDFLFLFKNKVKSRRNIKCFFLMYYVLYKKKFYNSNILRKIRKDIDNEYHYKCRNFKFVQNKNINTLNKISLDNSIINVHSSILYKISQFYSILAYFANQRKNYIVSFICYYILNDEQSAINSLLRIYNDELIYYYFNNEKEYGYIRKCAFRFYHLAKNMWPSNVKLESIEQKSYLILSILFMKKKMFEEAFAIFSLALIPDNMLEKLSTADYYNIDLSSNFLVTLRELCKKNYKISELVDQSMVRSVIKFLLPIKDKLDAQVVESINYLGSLSF